MPSFPTSSKELCTPSFVYFFVSMLFYIGTIFQNISGSSLYTAGSFTCRVPSIIAIFIIKLLYILFWTWILNLICKSGHKTIAWLLILFPFILIFIIAGLIMINK